MSSFNIQDLPVETQLIIFHHISFVDYFRALRRVCALWRDLVDDIVSRLHVLNLANTFNINKILAIMGPRMTTLRELNLTRCVSLNDRALISLVSNSCAALVRVDLAKCHLLTDASAKALADRHAASLQSLTLDRCNGFTFAGLKHLLTNATALRTLSMRKLKTSLVDAATTYTFPALERLDISGCTQLNEQALRALVNATQQRLVELRIDECRAASAIATVLPALPNLRVLSMSYGGGVGDALLAQVAAHCSQLHTLELESATGVSDAGVIAVASLPGLARLNLNCCFMITSKSAEELHKHGRNLVYLDVKGCQSIAPAVLDKLRSTRPALKIIS